MTDTLSVKIVHGGTARRFTVDSAVTWAELADQVRRLFALTGGVDSIRLAYVDEDGDRVVFNTDLELSEALQQHTTVNGQRAVRFWLITADSDSQDISPTTSVVTTPSAEQANPADNSGQADAAWVLAEPRDEVPPAVEEVEAFVTAEASDKQTDESKVVEKADPAEDTVAEPAESATTKPVDTVSFDEKTLADVDDSNNHGQENEAAVSDEDKPAPTEKQREQSGESAQTPEQWLENFVEEIIGTFFGPAAASDGNNDKDASDESQESTDDDDENPCAYAHFRPFMAYPAATHAWMPFRPSYYAPRAYFGMPPFGDTFIYHVPASRRSFPCAYRYQCGQQQQQRQRCSSRAQGWGSHWRAYAAAPHDKPADSEPRRCRRRCARRQPAAAGSSSSAGATADGATTNVAAGWAAFLDDLLAQLHAMGFQDTKYNRHLLRRYNGSLVKVIDALTRGKDSEEAANEVKQPQEQVVSYQTVADDDEIDEEIEADKPVA